MTRKLVVQPPAELDLVEARDWYEARRRGLGVEFLAAIDGVLGRIERHPFMYPDVHRGTRRAVVRRFPYLVYFVVDEESIRVVACLHVRRRPGVVRSRV